MAARTIYPGNLEPLSEGELAAYKRRIERYKERYYVKEYEGESRLTSTVTTDKEGRFKSLARLEALCIAQENVTPDVVVIHVRGNSEKLQEVDSELIEDLKDFKAKDLNAAMFVHNPRSTQGSSGVLRDKQNLIDDLNALYLEASRKYPGVPIVIKAHSLGTAIASEWVESKSPKNVSFLWLGRGLSRTGDVGAGFVLPSNKKDSKLARVFAGAIDGVLSTLTWKFNTIDRIKSIRSKGITSVTAIDAENDTVITDLGQLTQNLINNAGIIPIISNLQQDGISEEAKEEAKKQLIFKTEYDYLEPPRNLPNFIEAMGTDEYAAEAFHLGLTNSVLTAFKPYYQVFQNMVSGTSAKTKEELAKILEGELAKLDPAKNKDDPDPKKFPYEEFDKYVAKFNRIAKSTHNMRLSDLHNDAGANGQEFYIEQAVQARALFLERKEREETEKLNMEMEKIKEIDPKIVEAEIQSLVEELNQSSEIEEAQQPIEETQRSYEPVSKEIEKPAETEFDGYIKQLNSPGEATLVLPKISKDFINKINDYKDLDKLLLNLQHASYPKQKTSLFSRFSSTTSPYQDQASGF